MERVSCLLKNSIRLRLLEFIMIPVRQTFMLQQDKHTNNHLNTANKSVLTTKTTVIIIINTTSTTYDLLLSNNRLKIGYK